MDRKSPAIKQGLFYSNYFYPFCGKLPQRSVGMYSLDGTEVSSPDSSLFHTKNAYLNVKKGDVLEMKQGLLASTKRENALQMSRGNALTEMVINNNEGDSAVISASVMDKVVLAPGGALEVKDVKDTRMNDGALRRYVNAEYVSPKERSSLPRYTQKGQSQEGQEGQEGQGQEGKISNINMDDLFDESNIFDKMREEHVKLAQQDDPFGETAILDKMQKSEWNFNKYSVEQLSLIHI